MMFKSFEIQHFRGFDKFILDDLKVLNLIGGLNNTGKTSLLEAFYIHAGFGNAELLVRTNFWRGLLPTATSASSVVQDFIGACFFKYEVLTPVIFESIDDGSKKRTTKVVAATPWETQVTSTIASGGSIGQQGSVGQQRLGLTLNLGKLTFEEEGLGVQQHNLLLTQTPMGINLTVDPNPKAPSFPCHFLHTKQPYVHAEDAAAFSTLRQEGKDGLVLKALQAMDATVEGIEVLTPGGTPIMFVRRKGEGRLMPLPLLGDGAVRLVNIILKIGLCSLGIVLIDELAFGFHYTVLQPVWRVLFEAAQIFGTQLICTTHSFEAIEAAYYAFVETGKDKDFQYIRLERSHDKVTPVVYDNESLSLAIANGNEVR